MSLSTLASLGMAIGAPLVYADQAYSIYRKQDARGFSHDVCAVLLIANITRCFFWLGERFEFALLLQSILMIAAQLGLLYLCIRFKPVTRWSKSISSDGARVVFNADEGEDAENHRRQQEQEQQQGANGQAERDLMDLNVDDDGNNEEEEGEGYANKQPLLVTLVAMFRGRNAGSSSSSSTYGRLSSTDHNSYTSSSSLPPPTTTTNAASSSQTSRMRNILSHLTPTSTSRPLNFWQWSDYNSYLVFLLLFSFLLLLLYIIFSSSSTFIAMLGYVALGLESTLPIPQLIANHRRKSLAGFRASVLVGWLGGDSFKLLYFLLRKSPVQFTTCAVFQLSVDLAILAQSRLYREQTERDEEEMNGTRRGEQRVAGNGTGAGGSSEIEEDITDELPTSTSSSSGRGAQGSKNSNKMGPAQSSSKTKKGTPTRQGQREEVAEEEDGLLLQDPHHVISIEADDDDDDDEGDLSNGVRGGSRRK